MSLTRKASSAAKMPPKPPRHDLAAALAERDAELAEARSRQAATAEILRVISQSPTDARPVFERIVVAAARLLRCDMAFVLLRDADAYVHTAGATPEGPMADLAPEHVPIDASANFPSRAFLAKTMLHLPDWSQIDLPEHERRIHERFGVNSALYLPLLRERECIGVLAFAGKRADMFRSSEIAQAESFRDQALIAIENARLFNETQEALEQQKAASEVLQVISRSTFDLQSVFRTLVENAVRLCGAKTGMIFQRDGAIMRVAAASGATPEFVAYVESNPIAPGRGAITGRAALEGRTVHVLDIENDPEYSYGGLSLERYRTIVAVPLMRNGAPVGVFTLWRHNVEAFTPRQIALVETFADQAVVAIENVRLFNETQEALEQQKASAEVLGAISKSVADTAPVFETILDACQRLFGSEELGIYTIGDDQMVRTAAWRGPRAEEARQDVTPLADSVTGRVIRERRPHHIPDLGAVPNLSPTLRDRVNRHGGASLLYAPMLQEDRGLGSIVVVRWPPRPFSDREQALLQTFADQAAIAIENVRLFRETQQALERQTATADILKVIAGSPTDVQPVFEAIATSANKLIGGFSTAVLRFVGGAIHMAAFTPTNPKADEVLRTSFPRPLAEFPPFLLVRDGETIQFADTEADRVPSLNRELARLRGYRSMLIAPLMSKSAAIGMISVTRKEPGAFAAHQVQLLQTFADQAVIAIENVRLFDEVQARTRDLEESLAQQTATANVLKVISRSAFDLDAVLNTLTDSARSLSGAATAAVFLRDGEFFPLRAESGVPPKFRDYMNAHPARPGKATLIGRVAMTGEAVLIPDAPADPDYSYGAGPQIGRYRALFGAPMIRDGRVEGVFGLMHPEPSAFMPRQMEMVRAFADQAVIAIENARLFGEVQARTKDLQEALQQQTATADVLKVISRSVSDVAPVFETILESCQRLLGLESVAVYLVEGDMVRGVAQRGWKGGDWGRDVTPLAGSSTGSAIAERRPLHIPDLADKPDLPEDKRTAVREAGGITVLYAPMLLEDRGVGSIVVSRMPARPFSEKEIALAQSFADQAAIAIQNARMFDEVQARTREVEGALAQQTATADVLKVISRSAFDLDAVFDALLASAVSLIGSRGGTICVRDGDGFRYRAVAEGRDSAMWRYLSEHPPAPGRQSVAGRVLLSGKPEIITDTLLDGDLKVPVHALAGSRAVAGVPLLRDNKVEGALLVGRAEAGPFDARQIELLQTFADQAVIAIENVRLFDEVQARTRDLTEALRQQTATAEVLKVISRSAFDLQAVWRTLVDSASTLCEAPMGLIELLDGDVFRMVMQKGYGEAFERYLLENPLRAGSSSSTGRAASTGEVSHIPDVLQDPHYLLSEAQRLGGYRSNLAVPLLRENKVIGVFVLCRPTPGPFTERQIELVKTFADQAVIAIENVRLFDEVQARTRDLEESLQQQTATANVLKVISRSAFDLQAVLTTLAESARELCGASFVTLFMRDGDEMRLRAESGCTSEIVAFLHAHPIRAGRETFTGRVMLSGAAVHLPDVLADAEYDFGEAPRIGNYRAVLGVPLLREGRVEGIFGLARSEPIRFTERQIEMVSAFADQAVVAIENARLFDEVQARTKELAASLDDLRKAQDRLIQSEKLASLGQLTAGIAHEIKNPLNFVNNFSALSRELVDELADVIKAGPLDEARRGEAEELIGMIDGNLDKVVQHGKRADSIVKNMLLHSREGSGERSTTNINTMVEEALNLAYHGMRAEKPGFNVAIVKSLDPNAGTAEVYAQEMTRVLLNLISNGFYATSKRKSASSDGAYEPTITASTRDLGHSVEIAIRDNGTGIPDEVKAKMFNPFFTTKPAGEGTGLGLSLSHDIVVKQHGGTIEVSTEPGAYTQFTIVVPRAGAKA